MVYACVTHKQYGIGPRRFYIQRTSNVMELTRLKLDVKRLGFSGYLYVDVENIYAEDMLPRNARKYTGSFIYSGTIETEYGKNKLWHKLEVLEDEGDISKYVHVVV